MTGAKYAKQLTQIGKKTHFYKGVWWQEVKPFYYWPADLFQTFPSKQSRPSMLKALIGFEHIVYNKSEANSILSILSIENLQNYALEKLPKKKRNQIRRGLEKAKVERIMDKNIIIKQGHLINQSALSRQGRFPNIAKCYTSYTEWEKEINKNFSLIDREIWGAFIKDKLIAYIRTINIEKNIFITNAMSHSDYLSFYPNDALIYTYLTNKKETAPDIKRVLFGLYCSKKSINKFKMQLGFQKVDFPLYRWVNPMIKPLLYFTKYKHYFNYAK